MDTLVSLWVFVCHVLLFVKGIEDVMVVPPGMVEDPSKPMFGARNFGSCENALPDASCELYITYCYEEMYKSAMEHFCEKACGFCGECKPDDPMCESVNDPCNLMGGYCQASCSEHCKGQTIEPPVEAVWGDWSDFGECSVECGGGYRTRTRECEKGRCNGANSESIQCNTHDCPNECNNQRSTSWCRERRHKCSNDRIRNECKQTCKACGTTTTVVTSTDECTLGNHNCDTNAVCKDTAASFKCSCNKGYTGDGFHCTDVNECEKGTDECHRRATCTNTPGSYTCDCKPGYQGDGRNSCSDINECKSNNNDCHVYAECTNTAGSYECECVTGFTGDGMTCVDLDECNADMHNCHREATCSNVMGTFECTCNSGYTGNGRRCSDINECELNVAVCDKNANCANTDGSYICACKRSFVGDGVICLRDVNQPVNECDLNVDDCDTNAECIDTDDSYVCLCKTGYMGDGKSCSDIDECEDGSHNCDADAKCTNNKGSYSCKCEQGLMGDGKTCGDFDECKFDTHNCHNHANCINIYKSYNCECKPGYKGTGKHCEDVNECRDGTSACHSEAVCTNNDGSYRCDCKSGYLGDGRTECKPEDPNSPSSCSVHCGKGVRLQMKRDKDNIKYPTYSTCGWDECPQQDCQAMPGYSYRRVEDLDNSCCKVPNDQSCGYPRFNDNQRVLGGVNANPLEYPWQVFVYAKFSQFSKVKCGGAILNSQWILTAGHCVKDSHSPVFDYTKYKILFGETYVTDNRLDAADFNVERIISHPGLSFPKDDIALIKMKSPINFNKLEGHAMSICLPNGEDPPPDSTCYITGFGLSSNSAKTHSEKLQKAPLEVFDMKICEVGYKDVNGFLNYIQQSPSKLICAGALESSQDSCRGDSGSPLVCQRAGSCAFYVAGIVSFGPTPCAMPNQPGMYTRVANYEDWINSYINS